MDFNISLIKPFTVMRIFERRENCLTVFAQKNHFEGVENESHNLCSFPYR